MLRTWEAHLAAEFEAHDVDATMATMTAEPRVVHIGPMTGAAGGAALRQFYSDWFVHCHPPDTKVTLLTRVLGESTIVDQMIHRFTHTIEMPWLLPGISPTGRAVAVPIVVFVEFVGDKIDEERIYFDQASVLAQVGVLDRNHLPVVGAEAADLLSGLPVERNRLITRARPGPGGPRPANPPRGTRS